MVLARHSHLRLRRNAPDQFRHAPNVVRQPGRHRWGLLAPANVNQAQVRTAEVIEREQLPRPVLLALAGVFR